MGLKFKDFLESIKKLEGEVDPDSLVYASDQYGEKNTITAVITYNENNKKVLEIEL